MKYFDDGERMRYNAPSIMLDVVPSKVEHPITYPPAGFVVEDDKWVFKGV
jgi:hypothetical protein